MKARRVTAALAAIGLGVLSGAAPAAGEQITITTAGGFDAALDSAGDGDVILLAPGTYVGKFTATNLTGVTIRSLDPDNRAVIDADGHNEAIQFGSPKRVTFADLIFENARYNGINIDPGGGTPAEDLTLRNLIVRNTDPSGNNDGIKLSHVVGFHVDRVVVDTWGGSSIDMVGCHNGLIENSLFVNGPTGSSEDSTGVRPKGGSANIIIRANRFVGASNRPISIGGATGLSFFYPFPHGPVEADDITVEGNVIVGAEAPVSYINIDGGVTVRNNLIHRPSKYVMRMLKLQTNPGFVDTANGAFTDNVVTWNDGDIQQFVYSGAATLPATFTFARNQWYNATSPGNSTPTLPASETDGVYGVDPGLDVDEIVPWSFSWGLWLVNASGNANALTVSSPESLRVATPGEGAEFDVGLAYPLIGEWTFSAMPGAEVSMQPFSQVLLIDPTVIPDDAKVLGDADVDGDVDVDDLAAVAANWGSALPTWAMGDFDDDDAVDLDDMITVAVHWTGAGAPAAVPEPATAALLAFAAAGLAGRRRPVRPSA